MCIRDRDVVVPRAGVYTQAARVGTKHLSHVVRGVRLRRGAQARGPVSYTHLDVYKRQAWWRWRICLLEAR